MPSLSSKEDSSSDCQWTNNQFPSSRSSARFNLKGLSQRLFLVYLLVKMHSQSPHGHVSDLESKEPKDAEKNDQRVSATNENQNSESRAETTRIDDELNPRLRLFFHDNRFAHQRLLTKLTWRLLPFLMVLYTLSFLDRSNLSNVHKPMITSLNMSEDDYGVSASMFFVPYVLLEVPSNMILQRVDARRWLARIIFTWGIISTCMVAVNGYGALVLLRVLLGVAEAGFFPGIVYYLTFWFTPEERAHRLFFIFVAQPVAGLLGGLIAYPILNYLDGAWGLEGWRWVFLIEGVPTVIMGVVTWFYLPAGPSSASWLSQEEKDFLIKRVSVNPTYADPLEHKDEPVRYAPPPNLVGPVFAENEEEIMAETLSSPNYRACDAPPGLVVKESDGWLLKMSAAMRARVKELYRSTFSNRIIWYSMCINFLTLTPVQAITFYLPAIASDFGLGEFGGNLLSAIPYSVAVVYMYLNSRHADRHGGERFWHVLSSNIIGFIGLGLSAVALDLTANAYFKLSMLCIAAAGIWGAKPPLMAWFTSILPGNLAVAVASVTTIGNISGVTAPLMMSNLKTLSGDYVTGCLALMGALVVASVLVVLLNREIIRTEKLFPDSDTTRSSVSAAVP